MVEIIYFFPCNDIGIGLPPGIFPFLLRLCANGVFNFDSVGQMQKVTDEFSRTKDKRKGIQITLYAAIYWDGSSDCQRDFSLIIEL